MFVNNYYKFTIIVGYKIYQFYKIFELVSTIIFLALFSLKFVNGVLLLAFPMYYFLAIMMSSLNSLNLVPANNSVPHVCSVTMMYLLRCSSYEC